MRIYLSLRAMLALVLCALMMLHAAPAGADDAEDFYATLSSAEQAEFKAWYTAQTHFDRRLDAYWYDVEKKRKGRHAKRSKTKFFETSDYVWTFPPEYTGPRLSPGLDQRWSRFQAAREKAKPSKPREQQPDINDFLAAARQHYGFVPTRVPEHEFKKRYATEALRLGMTKQQVVRVYALETGGNGTADTQSGVNPITKKGRPISSALGYAQLLHANTIGELVKSGSEFIKRLKHMASTARDPARVQELRAKIAALERMHHVARSVPNQWSKHMALAKTPRGYGIHAINLDGDIGPWLQSVKLRGLKDFAARKGIRNLSAEEFELMNLSGPATGLEMMDPVGLTAPTPNFFARSAYYRNKMVNGKTSAELLAEFTRRMDSGTRKPGAIEFSQAFDEVSERLPWQPAVSR